MASLNGTDVIGGTCRPNVLIPSTSCISNSHIAASAGIDATKSQQQYIERYSQPNTTATAETRVLHEVYGSTGSVVAFRAGSIAIAVGAATVTLDLKKNGSTILTGVITLDNANTARVAEAATLLSSSLVVGDVLEVVLTATAAGGTIPTGVFCELVVREDPA